jgi:sugar-specific transcriptional regulator TrmB
MSDNKDTIRSQLHALNLSIDEAEIYLSLLQEPSTHLRLSRETGISRTKVYRLVEQLKKRSLVSTRVDDRGSFLVAADPSTLEVELVTAEESLKQRRSILEEIVPSLAALQAKDSKAFVVRTYEGEEGLKQMCWHELKTRGELLSFGNGTIEEIIANHRWAEKHRALSAEAGYTIREIISTDAQPTFTSNDLFMQRYKCRSILPKLITFNEQTVIYNDTVAIYHKASERKLGVEIISPAYATMFRNIFEHYWQLATPSPIVRK